MISGHRRWLGLLAGPPVASGGLEPGLERWDLERRKERERGRRRKGSGGGMECTVRTGPRWMCRCSQGFGWRSRGIGWQPEGFGLDSEGTWEPEAGSVGGRCESSSDAS